jgi:hypothetical protein
MADTKITDLTSVAASTGDELVVSTTALADRKVTAQSVANLANALGSVSVSSATITAESVTNSTIGTLTAGAIGPTTIGGIHVTTALVAPSTNDGVTLGTSALKFADLYVASGGVINFSTGEQGGSGATITHASSQLAIAASTVLLAGSVRVTTSVIQPTSNDGVALGSSALKFSDLFLASGAVIDFSTGNATITHAANTLTVAAGTVAISGDATMSGTLSVTGQTTLGGVLILTTGQINFPSAQNDAANVNCLDDYEEGTFSPRLTPATTGTYNAGYNAATTGAYTKIGRNVYVTGFIQITTHTSGTGSGQLGISALPFNGGTITGNGVVSIHNPSSGLRAPFSALVSSGLGVARVQMRVTTTGASSSLNLADITTGANQLNFTGTYII